MNRLHALMSSLRKEQKLKPAVTKFLVHEHDEIKRGKRSRSAAVKEDAKLSIATFRARFDEYNHDDPATADYFHCSQIGGCLRRMWYRAMNAPTNGVVLGSEMLQSHLTFEIGTYAHVMLQNLFARAGILEAREIPVRSDADRIIGHADGILRFSPAERMLLEIKTIKSRAFSELTAPKPEHVKQATLYMGYLKLPAVCFVYFSKDDSALKEFIVPFSETDFNKLRKRVATFKSCVANRTAPDREGDNPNRMPCSYCEFSSVCYVTEDSKRFMASLKNSSRVNLLKKAK